MVFKDLPCGDVAIAYLHAEDSSLDMIYGTLHLPTVGYCFPNNIKFRFHVPKLKKAKFALDRGNVRRFCGLGIDQVSLTVDRPKSRLSGF